MVILLVFLRFQHLMVEVKHCTVEEDSKGSPFLHLERHKGPFRDRFLLLLQLEWTMPRVVVQRIADLSFVVVNLELN